METIRANLHGHVLADFGRWWKKQYGLQEKNLSKVLTDKCIKKGIDIFAITNDPFWDFPKKSRFSYIFGYSQNLSKDYRMQDLGRDAFVVENASGQKVHYLNGQSIRVKEEEREHELLIYGTSRVPEHMSFADTSSCLNNNGIIGILEHPFAEGHHGGISKQELLDLWDKGYFHAVEYNAKIAVPKLLARLPVQKFKDYSREHNENLARLAQEHNIPLIATDDDDSPTHIGSAYTEFDASKIRLDRDEHIVEDMNRLIVQEDFKIQKGHLGFFEFMKYAGWILTVKDHGLGLREKYNKKHGWIN